MDSQDKGLSDRLSKVLVDRIDQLEAENRRLNEENRRLAQEKAEKVEELQWHSRCDR